MAAHVDSSGPEDEDDCGCDEETLTKGEIV
jgi:hypothetical protein